MASNFTPFYGLSLWAGTDKFSRADFNNDNSKIDTALANINFKQQAMPWECVASYQPEATLASMSLSLEGIDLSKYLHLLLFVDLKQGTYVEGFHYLRLNGITGNTYYKTGRAEPLNYLMRTDLKNGYPKKRTVRFMPYEEGTYVCCSYESMYGDDAGVNNAIATDVQWENLKSIDYVAASTEAPIPAGTGLYLYGIKRP